MLRRAAREHQRWIGDGSPNHRRYYHIEYASPMFTRASPMCRRCVAYVSGTVLNLVYIAECSPTARRCSVIYRRWYLASKHREKMHALKCFLMSRCLGEAWRLLAYVADHSPNHWCMVALPWRCSNVCIARASGGLKILVGPYIACVFPRGTTCSTSAPIVTRTRLLKYLLCSNIVDDFYLRFCLNINCHLIFSYFTILVRPQELRLHLFGKSLSEETPLTLSCTDGKIDISTMFTYL